MNAARELISYPTVLAVEDFQAVLDQCVDPESFYRIEGWIIRAMAAELLASRAGRTRNGQGRRDNQPVQLSFFGGPSA